MRAPTPANNTQLAEALAAALAAAVDARLDELVAERVADAQSGAAPTQLDSWLSVAQVAELVGVSKRTVHRALRSGALLGDRTGGTGSRWHIRPDAVATWLEPQAATPRLPPLAAPGRAPRAAPKASTRRRSFAERARSTTRS